jgi:hypothetical protein
MPTDPTTTPTTPAAARVTIRRATPDDAAEVVTMVEEIADLEDQPRASTSTSSSGAGC